MRQITLSDRLRYRFDNIMSRGTIALIGWLGLISLILIVVVSLIVLAGGTAPTKEDGTPFGFGEMVWFSLMHTMDAGTLGGQVGTPGFLLAMFIVTLGGIFIVSILIGVLTSGIEAKLDELRKGRSLVVEKDHTVILGWSSQIFSIISELVIANENRSGACIAILAEKDKVEMEDEIRSRIDNTGRTRIVCRTGNPIDLNDLQIINPNDARSIIVLSSEADDPDSHVIKTVLALTSNPQRRSEPYHIVAEIRKAENMEVARMVGKDEAQLALVDDLISRIAVQTCRQSGLSVVYIELLDFGGDEIYFKDEPSLAGKPFGEALFAYEQSAIIGLRFKDGRVQVNPPMDQRISAGDRLIAISKDDDTIVLSGRSDYGINTSAIRNQQTEVEAPERTLILGWNQRGTTMINELDNYVMSGSEVIIVAESASVEEELARDCANVKNQRITFQRGSTTDRRMLDSLNVTQFNHVITLSYSDDLPAQEADARTLITLLHLRDISEKTGKRLSIVSEMLDMRNRELAEVTRADDFIVSDKLVSLLLAQVSENRDLMAVFADLFDADGSEIYLKPIGNYIQTGQSLNFYTALESARQRNEIAIGYRIFAEAGDVSKAYGLHVNPNKAEMVTFAPEDKLIVISEQG